VPRFENLTVFGGRLLAACMERAKDLERGEVLRDRAVRPETTRSDGGGI
jgi:hypothetical protein